MEGIKTIVLVLKEGKDFSFSDVELIVKTINNKWESAEKPRIVCIWDRVTSEVDLGWIELLPMKFKAFPGTWTRIQLYGPEMEKYKPFLYVDLDTAVIRSIENIFDLVKDPSKFITLEDFYQKGELATGVVWFPKNCQKTEKVWKSFYRVDGPRMDLFIRSVCRADEFWQHLTNSIYDFKAVGGVLMTKNPPEDANLVCFHGKPRIPQAQDIKWVREYIEDSEYMNRSILEQVSVIIPYNKDRGWLQEAIDSVPKTCQLILSKGDGPWTQNFNEGLKKAEGKYIKYLHEDDLLIKNTILDSVNAITDQKVDFIHGNALELHQATGEKKSWKPTVTNPTWEQLLNHNTIHSATLMYRREIFDKIGGFDETLGKGVSEEWEFNLRCLKSGLKLGYCDKFLGIYRRHPEQKIRTTPNDVKEEERSRVRAKYL